MKKIYTTLILMIAMIANITIAKSQNYLDVLPTTSENPSLSTVILHDTTATGERVPDRIYRLQRGEKYLMDKTIQTDYPITIIDHGDNSLAKPMIIRGKNAEGANITIFFILAADGVKSKFKNIFFNGIDLEKSYGIDWTQALRVTADDASIDVQGCIFNAFIGGATAFQGENLKVYIRDCIYRNGVAPHHMFFGQQITLPALPVDTLVVLNSTYFNNGAFFIHQEGGLIGYQLIEHNTIFTSLIDVIRLRFSSNASMRSNLFYGTHAYGDSEEFRTLTVYEPDNTSYSIISMYEVPSNLLDEAGIDEDERKLLLTNNAYFTPQPIRDYWEGNAEVDDDCAWMNTRTQNLFDTHQGFIQADNYNMDPNFNDTAMDEWVTQAVANYGINYRATLNPGEPLSGNAGSNNNYDEHLGNDVLLGIQWPLPEDLAYSNATLLAGGHDGLPVGDLNWFPEQRASYVDPITLETSTSTIKNIAFTIHPNPTTDKVIVNTEEKILKIELYNFAGNLVLSNKNINQTETSIDLNNLSTGIYLIKTYTKEGYGVSKIIKE